MKAIEDFQKRYHRAVYGGSNEIRMTIKEAAELARDLDALLVRVARTSDTEVIEIAVDGGKLGK